MMALDVLLAILTVSIVILLFEVARLKKNVSIGAFIQLHESIDIKAIFQRLEKLEAQAKEESNERN